MARGVAMASMSGGVSIGAHSSGNRWTEGGDLPERFLQTTGRRPHNLPQSAKHLAKEVLIGGREERGGRERKRDRRVDVESQV